MDNISLILTALESAAIAGGQSALNDTVKDAFLNLRDRVLKKLGSKQHSDIVLSEYEQNPETWRKPLTELLMSASLSEDEEIVEMAKRLLQLTGLSSGLNIHTTNVFHGQVQGSAVGSNNVNTFHITNNSSAVEDLLAKGRENVKRGYDFLMREDYDAAVQSLEEAERQLHDGQSPNETAQVKYLRSIALLNGQRPFSITLQTMRRVESLLHSAIKLHSLHSYYYTFALFKRDFARNGLPQYLSEAQNLARKAQSISRTTVDEENLNLLAHCQSRLISDAKQW
jgi:hypothetical protein